LFFIFIWNREKKNIFDSMMKKMIWCWCVLWFSVGGAFSPPQGGVPKEIFIARKAIKKYHGFWNRDLQQEAWLSYYSQPHSTTESVISSCNRMASQQTRRRRYLVDLDENKLKEEDEELAYRPLRWTPALVMTTFRWTFRRYQKEKKKYLRHHHHHHSIGHADALHFLRVDEDWKP